MSRNKASNRFSQAMNTTRARARVATWLNPATASAKPLAKSSAAAAKRSMVRTRAWAAPQVDHAGHFFQDTAAPKISALLFSTARRLAPARTRGPRWAKLAGASAVGGAAASVAAVAARSRRKQDVKESQDDQGPGDSPSAD